MQLHMAWRCSTTPETSMVCYPVLHQLEAAGYLSRLERVVNGKVRKYYGLTRRGTAALSEVREKTAELVGEVLAEDLARRRRKVRRASARATRIRPDTHGTPE
jgi:DNA-binding PadR family transcriptional regulator